MSIVRVGLSENKKFAEGYDAIDFGKKKESKQAAKPKAKKAAPKKKAAAKKKPGKKK